MMHYSSYSAVKLYDDYHNTMSSLERICGKTSLTNIIRIHSFEGDKDSLCRMVNDELYPCKGFLTADDKRKSYYLTEKQCCKLRKNGSLYDKETGITFYRSDFRIERIEGLNNILKYKNNNSIHFFTHEWILSNQTLKILINRVLANL